MALESKPSAVWNPETKDHPFTFPDADVRLVSSDGVEFRVHKLVLSLASPFFRSMFTLPQPHKPIGDLSDTSSGSVFSTDLPAIDVSENSSALYHLLKFVYPIPDPVPTELRDVRHALAAALKYEMEETTDILKDRLTTFIGDNSWRVYGIACILDLEDIAQLAAKEFCRQGLHATNPNFPELDEMTAGAYYRLLAFSQSGRGVVGSGFSFIHPDTRSSTQSIEARPSVTDAPRPFNRPDADVILCSSDLVHFYVHSPILCMVSSVLEEKLRQIPQASQSSKEQSGASRRDLPVLVLEEDSRIISWILRYYYCAQLLYTSERDPFDRDIGTYSARISAAKKYHMTNASSHLKSIWDFLSAQYPLRTYFIAYQLNNRRFAQAAARAIGEALSYVEEMETVFARAIYHLVKFHRDCRAAVTALTSDISWLAPSIRSGFETPATCLSYRGAGCVSACWHGSLMEKIRSRLPSSFCGDMKNIVGLVSLFMKWSDFDLCPHCRDPVLKYLVAAFCSEFQSAVDSATYKIKLNWY